MGPRVLLVDNYDSFVYNLVQELGELGAEPVVFRNDAIDVAGIRAERPDAVLISPGPGRPEDGGVSLEAIRELAGEIPLLGVCLGHQCIGQAYGGAIVGAPHLMHGKTSEIHHDGRGLFAGSAQPLRRHALPLAGGAARFGARRAGGHGHLDGRRGHGAAPPHLARRGGAVPPRVGAHGVGPGPPGQLPRSAGRGRAGLTGAARAAQPPCLRRWLGGVTGAVDVVVDDGRGGRGGAVVVVVGWQTEMFTVDPLFTWALAAGLWVSTLPGCAPPGHVVSKVVLATRPAPVMAEVAAFCGLADDAGDRGAGSARDDQVDRGVRRDADAGGTGSARTPHRWAGPSRRWSGCRRSGCHRAAWRRRRRATARPRSAPTPRSGCWTP